ncbi:MAG: LamG domain-containing protein [Rhodothermaceae bacterium]
MKFKIIAYIILSLLILVSCYEVIVQKNDSPNKTGLIAYYKFDGNVKDYSSNANHGIAKKISFNLDKDKNYNSAVEFNGIDNKYVEIPFNNTINTANGITISAWIYKNSDSTFQAITSRYIASNKPQDRGWNFAFKSTRYGGNLYFYFRDKYGQFHCFRSKENLARKLLKKWHQVIVSCSFGNGKIGNLFVDGELVEVEWNYPIGRNENSIKTDLTNNLYVGITKGEASGELFHWFDGIIDELILYNYQLSDIEIQRLFDYYNK